MMSSLQSQALLPAKTLFIINHELSTTVGKAKNVMRKETILTSQIITKASSLRSSW